jgi:hypothetical protein
MPSRISRFAPLAGIVYVVLMVVGFASGGSSPDPDASNAKIVSYLHDHSKFNANVVAFFLVLAALLFLIGFYSALRTRLAAADPGSAAPNLAFGAGIASSVLLILAITLFVAPVFASHDAPRHVLDPGIYRFTQDAGYMIWVASTVAGALVAWSTAAVALRGGLPRWFGFLSAVIGVVALGSFFFFPIMAYLLWIAIASIVLFLRPAPVAATPVAA